MTFSVTFECVTLQISDSYLDCDSGHKKLDRSSFKPHTVPDSSNSVHSKTVSDFSFTTQNLED